MNRLQAMAQTYLLGKLEWLERHSVLVPWGRYRNRMLDILSNRRIGGPDFQVLETEVHIIVGLVRQQSGIPPFNIRWGISLTLQSVRTLWTSLSNTRLTRIFFSRTSNSLSRPALPARSAMRCFRSSNLAWCPDCADKLVIETSSKVTSLPLSGAVLPRRRIFLFD